MRQRRKRSAAVTLLLAGTMSDCGEPVPQQDVYKSLAESKRGQSNFLVTPVTEKLL